MTVLKQPFQLLYVSQLADRTAPDVLEDIAAVSRPRNAACGISGALLFDGARFCQLLEGPENEIRILMARIELDPRHTDIVVLTAGPCVLPRLMTRWCSGGCDASALDVFETDSPIGAEVVLALFMSALVAADID